MESERETISTTSKSPSFNRAHLTKIISDNGGSILPQYPSEENPTMGKITIVSGRASCTLNYLYGLAAGDNLISFSWIHDSIKKQKKLPLTPYLLPLGWSSVTGEVIEQDIERSQRRDNSEILKGTHVCILSEDSSKYGKDWGLLLQMMGAAFTLKEKGKLDKRKVKVLVVVHSHADQDNSVTIDDAKSKKIPIVSSKWVIQSLINGTNIPYENFPISK